MNTIQNISAVIITYNEEQHIDKCVASLKEVVSEIIVVDSFSTDATKTICEKHNCTFLEKKWEGYAPTKNWGNAQANNPWILSIDADEVLSDELKASIKKAKQDGLDPKSVYRFNRLNNYCGIWLKYAGWYPDAKIRLFSNSPTQWEGEVHEKLVFSHNPQIKHLNGDLLHYSIKDKEDHIARVKKYCKLEKPYPNKLIAFLVALKTFVRSYIFRRGFMAGKLGFQVSLISAKAKWWRGRVE